LGTAGGVKKKKNKSSGCANGFWVGVTKLWCVCTRVKVSVWGKKVSLRVTRKKSDLPKKKTVEILLAEEKGKGAEQTIEIDRKLFAQLLPKNEASQTGVVDEVEQKTHLTRTGPVPCQQGV